MSKTGLNHWVYITKQYTINRFLLFLARTILVKGITITVWQSLQPNEMYVIIIKVYIYSKYVIYNCKTKQKIFWISNEYCIFCWMNYLLVETMVAGIPECNVKGERSHYNRDAFVCCSFSYCCWKSFWDYHSALFEIFDRVMYYSRVCNTQWMHNVCTRL